MGRELGPWQGTRDLGVGDNTSPRETGMEGARKSKSFAFQPTLPLVSGWSSQDQPVGAFISDGVMVRRNQA